MNNTNLEYPIKCISYYASNKNQIDKKHSFEWWMRGKLIRIISDKAFARGDILNIKNIYDNTNNITIINVSVNNEEYQQYPVLSFVSSRLVYNKYSKFEAIPDNNIKILKQLEQINNNNYSIGFIILISESGTIKVQDSFMNNYFDINCNLSWN